MAAQPVHLQIIRKGRWLPPDLAQRIHAYDPQSELGKVIKACLGSLTAEQAAEVLHHLTSCVVVESSLAATIIRHPDSDRLARPILGPRDAVERLRLLHEFRGEALARRDFAAANALVPALVERSRALGLVEDCGVVSRRVVTNAGVYYLVDAWQNLTEMENLKYHGIGTGSTAEAASDTALVTELTTQYNPDSTRATGSLTEGGTSNIFRTVGTNTVDASASIAEHGIFSQAATGGGTLWDRSLTGTYALSNGDSLQTTYDMTANSGG